MVRLLLHNTTIYYTSYTSLHIFFFSLSSYPPKKSFSALLYSIQKENTSREKNTWDFFTKDNKKK